MSFEPDSRNRSRIAFAVGGVFLLLGVAFATAMWTGSQDAPAEPIQSTGADDLSALSIPLLLNVSGIAVPVPEPVFQDDLNLSDDAVLSGHGFAIADAGGYAIGAQDAAIHGASGARFVWHAMPSNASIDGPSVRTDTEADAAIMEAEAALAQVAALWASGDVQALFFAVDGAGAEHGVLVPGLVRAPLGASHAAQPDDEAASQAQLHADGLLSVVGGGYGDLAAGLDEIHAVQSGLPAQLQGAYQAADAFGADAQSSLDAQHQERLDAIGAQAVEYEAAVQAAAQAHAEAAMAARDAGLADVDQAVQAQQEALQGDVAEARAEVDARLQAVQEAADDRLAYVAQLEADVHALAAADAVSAVHAQAQLDALVDARAAIEAQRDAAVQEAAEAHAAIEAQQTMAEALIQERAGGARQNITVAHDAAVAWAAQREAELLSSIDAALEAGLEMEAEGHAAASAIVESMVEARKQLLQEQALDAVAQARAEAEKAQRVVAIVQEDAPAEVGHDLDVILAVAKDHAAVPTPEREAAAAAWMEVHGALAAGLEQQMDGGWDVLVKAQAVLDAAAQAEAAIA